MKILKVKTVADLGQLVESINTIGQLNRVSLKPYVAKLDKDQLRNLQHAIENLLDALEPLLNAPISVEVEGVKGAESAQPQAPTQPA